VGRASGFAVVDITGKSFAHLNFKNFETSGKVDITSLRAGVYFLKLNVEGKAMVQSFMIP
jgi:YbbR domain-containing protein